MRVRAGIGKCALAVALSAGLSVPAMAGSDAAPSPGAGLNVMLFFLDGSRDFTIFVSPNSVSREVALKAATDKAGPFCAGRHQSHRIRFTKIKRWTWGTPDAWTINGSCS